MLSFITLPYAASPGSPQLCSSLLRLVPIPPSMPSRVIWTDRRCDLAIGTVHSVVLAVVFWWASKGKDAELWGSNQYERPTLEWY